MKTRKSISNDNFCNWRIFCYLSKNFKYMSVDRTRMIWNISFWTIRSYCIIAHQELVVYLILHERKLQFVHCKTVTSWVISTRKSTRLTCNKDPLSNFISYHLIPFSTSRKLRRKNKPIDVKKYFPFRSSYSSSHIRRKKGKSSRKRVRSSQIRCQKGPTNCDTKKIKESIRCNIMPKWTNVQIIRVL